MIRIILVTTIVIVFLILSVPLLVIEWLVGKKNPQKRDVQSLRIVQIVFRFILWVSGVKITVKGIENIPKNQAVLYVGNHRSYYDILVGYATVPGVTGFVAKKEMLRYPLLSNWMEYVNCLFLDRANMKEGLKTILSGIDKIKHGKSIWIFPEGTRNQNKDVLELLSFKEGSLKIAEKSGCPVIPVALTNTADVFENHFPWIKPAKVTIEFGEPFTIKELDSESKKFPGAYTRDKIISLLKNQLAEQEAE